MGETQYIKFISKLSSIREKVRVKTVSLVIFVIYVLYACACVGMCGQVWACVCHVECRGQLSGVSSRVHGSNSAPQAWCQMPLFTVCLFIFEIVSPISSYPICFEIVAQTDLTLSLQQR